MERATTQQQQAPPVAEELNLDYVKRQTQSLQKAISRILEDFEAYSQTNTTPKWSHPQDSTHWFPFELFYLFFLVSQETRLCICRKDILGRYKMINLDLFILVEEVKQVSKALVVFPKNVNAENASILPVMLASKLLPEMETDNNVKIDHLLQDVQSLPVPMQIETLKERIGKIAEVCGNAGKVLADARKAYGLAPQRGGPSMLPTTMDKAQAEKIREQENMLRAAVNEGEGIRLPPDQRQITTELPPHMVDALFVNDAVFNSSGMMQTQQSQSQQPEEQQQHQQQGGEY
ncbi:unnamed protein product [Brassica napus]|uniref:(rape) hypothetical protein n=1 Tax=Brassica napus TaxID=3708 RepID=A0A816TCD7_BRANA|nr:unnamed protein product [Brassica napus]